MNESFNWGYSGLEWSHFHALANLLSLRHGGQAEPSSLSDRLLEDDSDADGDRDDDARSLDTRFANQISNSGHERLKRRFLDCLAEFAANKKGGTAVACSAMKEMEDSVTIWIARNEGFSSEDEDTYKTLEKALSELSGDCAEHYETVLYEAMVLYQQSRIENYIPDLRASFKAFDIDRTRNHANSSEENSTVDDQLYILRDLLFRRNKSNTNTLEKHVQLVSAAYDLRQTKPVEEVLYKSQSVTTRSKKLWLDICRLARPRVSFEYFKDISTTLPSFKQVTVILIPRPSALGSSSQPRLNMKQTFELLQFNLNSATVQAVLDRRWKIERAKHDFAKLQKQRFNIHAEVQMLMYLNTQEGYTSRLFPYLGCSKLSCFMCNLFVRFYGRFKTRGCHGRLFKPWTVPNTDNLLPGQAARVAQALMLVQEEVVKKLKTSVDYYVQLERTSCIGGSSILDEQQSEGAERQIRINKLIMKSERERIAAMFKRKAEKPTISTADTISNLDRDGIEQECYICDRPTKRRCSLCNKGFYCSKSCQDKISGSHLFTCSKRPLTSADYLWKSMGEDLMPEDDQVLEDFGFTNAFGGERTNLLGLYFGLYRSGVSAETLHDWRIRGILTDKIKEFYFAMPEDCRGGYFPWFLKNQHVLEQQMSLAEKQGNLVTIFFDKARPYLSIEDRNKAPKDLEPQAKRMCFYLLAQALHRIRPNPIESNYYSFGFAACQGEGEESILVEIYLLLVTHSDGGLFYEINNRSRRDTKPVTFEEFWRAYEAGTLIQLIVSKDLTERLLRIPFLTGFLSVPPSGPHPSVWSLKQFLAVGDPAEFPPEPAINFDYGFMHCRDSTETCTLMEIYKSVLKTANSLGLHQACLSGQLFECVSDHIQMEESWRPLMKNFYPLEEPSAQVETEEEPQPNGILTGLLSLFSGFWRSSSV